MVLPAILVKGDVICLKNRETGIRSKQGSDLGVIDPDPVTPCSWIWRPRSAAAKPVSKDEEQRGRETATGRTLRDITEKVFFNSQRAMVATSLPALISKHPGPRTISQIISKCGYGSQILIDADTAAAFQCTYPNIYVPLPTSLH